MRVSFGVPGAVAVAVGVGVGVGVAGADAAISAEAWPGFCCCGWPLDAMLLVSCAGCCCWIIFDRSIGRLI